MASVKGNGRIRAALGGGALFVSLWGGWVILCTYFGPVIGQ